jgi:hypothetical protein
LQVLGATFSLSALRARTGLHRRAVSGFRRGLFASSAFALAGPTPYVRYHAPIAVRAQEQMHVHLHGDTDGDRRTNKEDLCRGGARR